MFSMSSFYSGLHGIGSFSELMTPKEGLEGEMFYT